MNKKTRSVLVLLGQVIVIVAGLFVLFQRLCLLFLPSKEIGEFWLKYFGTDGMQQVSEVYIQYPAVPTIYRMYFVFIILFTLFAIYILGRGRNIIEIIGIYLSYGIPRRRKNFGTIYNSATQEPLPFASIRLIQNDDNGHFLKVISQAVSDVEGKYRINTVEKEEDLMLQVRSSDFEIFEQPLTEINERNKTRDIIEDIYLAPLNTKKSSTIFRKAVRAAYKYLIPIIFFFSVITFILSFYVYTLLPNTIAVNYVVIYAIGTIWNIFALLDLGHIGGGFVKDKNTKNKIPFTTMKVFNDSKQIMSKVTDEFGKIMLPLKPGSYALDVFKEGYKPVKDMNISIDKRGYIKGDIYLEKDVNYSNAENAKKLDNPFS